ncbi:MAG: hypothetical protein JXO48_03395 [Deltaproteobacteria bacterium]|nr:hypothetical protein [Deltaproteobacteria bacterium]
MPARGYSLNKSLSVDTNSDGIGNAGSLLVWIATVFFVAKYFICRGPRPLDLINIVSVETAGILTVYFLSLLKGTVRINIKYVMFIIGGYIILLGHLMLVIDHFTFEYIIKLSRLYAYIVIILIFAMHFFNWHVFYRVLLTFCYASLFLTVIGAFFFPNYFVEIGYGFTRWRAMFSEPSAFAPVISIVLFDSLVRKRILGIILSLFVAHLVASGTVYVVMVLMAIMFCVRYVIFQKRNIKKLIILFSVPLFIMITVVFLLVYQSEVMKILDNSFNYGRIVTSIQSVSEEGHGNSRLRSLFNYYKIFKNEGGLFFGRGFNAATVFFGEESGENINREYSILHSFFFAFGIIGSAALIFILFMTWFYLNKTGNVFMLITYSAFLFSSLLNSSGGHTLYKFCYIFILSSIIYGKDGLPGYARSIKNPSIFRRSVEVA